MSGVYGVYVCQKLAYYRQDLVFQTGIIKNSAIICDGS